MPNASSSLTGMLTHDSNHMKNAITIINESDKTNTVLLTRVKPAKVRLSFNSISRKLAFFSLKDLCILNSESDNTMPAENDIIRAIE